jgi:NADPH:quinone reductase-like Zn-dependent oxidoreductase
MVFVNGHRHLGAGQTVLVQGTGGASYFAAQTAVVHGARAIITSSKDENLYEVKALIEVAMWKASTIKRIQIWEHKVLELANGIGRTSRSMLQAEVVNQSVAATKVQGVIALVRFVTGHTTALNLIPAIFARRRFGASRSHHAAHSNA